MRFLITGANGQLGTDVSIALLRQNEDVFCPTSAEMDIRNIDAVREVFRSVRPEAVIHCAAYNQVDKAETEPSVCHAVNVLGTGNVAALCRDYGAYMLSISSDYVFDGTKNGLYQTDDPKHPLSVYGASKSEGEDLVMSADARNAVIRTSWLFGPREHNFVEAILRKSENAGQISVVCDQIGTPTYTEDLAALIAECTLQRIPGLLHGTNEGFCSRAEFAQMILQTTGSPCTVRKIFSADIPNSARRPKNSRLDKRCLDEYNLKRLPHWQDALTRYIKRRIQI